MNVTFVQATEMWNHSKTIRNVQKQRKAGMEKLQTKKPGLGQKPTLKLAQCLGRWERVDETGFGNCGLSVNK